MGIPAEALLPFIFGNSGGGGASGDSAFIPSIGSLATISTGTSWSGDDPYTSTVTLTGYTVTGNTMVSVLPSSDVIEQMVEDGTTNIFISNNNGTLTANAIGAAPTAAMTLHVLCTESDASAELGNLPNIVGDGVLETLQATDLTDAINQLSSDLDDAKNAISQKAPLIINSASGNVASFADGADGMQIRKIVGTIVPQQAGTGDPSPTNIRTISGWTQANITASPTTTAADGVTLPINWQTSAGTIYGGTVTLNEDGSADVVSTHLFVTLDGSSDEDVTGGSDGAQARWYPPPAIRSIIRYPSIASTTNSFANYLKVVSQAASWIDNMFSMASNNYVYMRCDTIGALANWRTYLAEHPLQFCFELKQTAYAFYHFDNIGELYTYFGTNNVWIDTGAITECDYPADTKLYIDGLTAPDEDMIADANIASGKYFVVNNKLYLSTAAIAAGASIIPGTNCTETNIAEALNALNT